ncbi:TonB-dependent receptor domain-containing protein [Pedobacter steynii]
MGKIISKNLAIELSLFNKLNFVGEVYEKRTKNILQDRASIPTTMGLAVTTLANVGEAKSRGVDLNLDYTENFSGGAWFTIRGSLTFARGEYYKMKNLSTMKNISFTPDNPFLKHSGILLNAYLLMRMMCEILPNKISAYIRPETSSIEI